MNNQGSLKSNVGFAITLKVGVLVAAGCTSAAGQEMVLPTHEVPSPDVAAESLRSDQPRIGWIKLGPFDIIPQFQASFYYDDNVGTDETDEEEAMVLTLAPTVGMLASDWSDGMGKRLSLNYTPGFYFFFGDEVEDRNRVNHTALLTGDLGGAKLAVGFDQGFRFTTGPVIDLGTRADRMAYNTKLRSRFILGERSSLEINALLDIVDYANERYTSYYDVASENWLNFAYSSKLRLGAGLTVGYAGIDEQPDQTYQQLLARAAYAIAEKVDLTASAGAEYRQFKSGIDDTLNPIWSVQAAYRPRDSTTLRLRIYQRYETSSRTGGQSYVYTGVTVGLRQMLMQRLAINLAGTYSHADYESTVEGGNSTREDDLYIGRGSLDFYIKPRWTAGVFYEFQTRNSTETDVEYERNRIGLQTAWTF